MTKGENLRLQSDAGPKIGGDQSKESNQKRVHRGDDYDLTKDRGLCVSPRIEFSVGTGLLVPGPLIHNHKSVYVTDTRPRLVAWAIARPRAKRDTEGSGVHDRGNQ
jgi:hypothetical protein